MKKVLLSLVMIMSLLVLNSMGYGEQATAPEKTVTIGLMGSWTGPLGPMGDVSKKGGYLARKHINETGFMVGKEKYKLDFYEWDDRTDPKVAVAGVQKLMDEKDIKVMVGPMYSAATLAVQPITQPKGVIHIVYSSAPQVLRPGTTHTFRTVSDATMRANALSTYYKSMGIETIAFIVENMATALAMYDANAPAFEAQGGKVIGKEVFETGTTDFFTQLTKLKAKKPDVLFVCANPETAGLIIKQTREIGWPVQTVGEGNPPTGPDFWKIGGDAIEGHIDLTAVRGLDPGPEVTRVVDFNMDIRKKFFTEFKSEYNIDPNLAVGQLYYDMVHMAVEAIKAAGSITDTEKIRQAMLKLDWKGVSGRWRYFPNGQAWTFAMISSIHAKEGWTPLAIMEPGDAELKTWKVIQLQPVPQIKDIRKKRNY